MDEVKDTHDGRNKDVVSPLATPSREGGSVRLVEKRPGVNNTKIRKVAAVIKTTQKDLKNKYPTERMKLTQPKEVKKVEAESPLPKSETWPPPVTVRYLDRPMAGRPKCVWRDMISVMKDTEKSEMLWAKLSEPDRQRLGDRWWHQSCNPGWKRRPDIWDSKWAEINEERSRILDNLIEELLDPGPE